jgi:hypothetical protein
MGYSYNIRSIRIIFLRPLLSSLLKVLHPNVIEDIESDLELMRLAAQIFRKKLKYLNLEGAVDEFASLLMLQLDLRAEADHLVRFNHNFANEQDVIFPQVRASCACSYHIRLLSHISNECIRVVCAAGGRVHANKRCLD